MRTPPPVGPARSAALSFEPAEGTSQPGRSAQTQRVASQSIRPQSGPLAGLNPSFTPKFRRADPAEVRVPVLVDPESAEWLSHVAANEQNPAVAMAVGEFFAMQMYGMTTAPVTSTDPSVRMASTTSYDLYGNRQDIVARLEKGEILDRLTDVHVRVNGNPQIRHFTRADVDARRNAGQGWAVDNPAPGDDMAPSAGTSSFGVGAGSGAVAAAGSGPAGAGTGAGAGARAGTGVVRHAPQPTRAEPYPAPSSVPPRTNVTVRRREEREQNAAAWKAKHGISGDMVGDKSDDELIHDDTKVRSNAQKRLRNRMERAGNQAHAPLSKREQLEQNAAAWKAKRGIPDDMIGDTTDDELAHDDWKVRNNAQTKLRKRMVWAENPEHMRSIIHRSREKRAKEIFGEGANGLQYGKLFTEANKAGLTLQQAATRDDMTNPIRASGAGLAASTTVAEEQLTVASRVAQNRRLPPEQQMSDTAIAHENGVTYTSVYLERRRQEEMEASGINQA